MKKKVFRERKKAQDVKEEVKKVDEILSKEKVEVKPKRIIETKKTKKERENIDND